MTTETLVEQLKSINEAENSGECADMRENLQSFFDGLYSLYPDRDTENVLEHLSKSGLSLLRRLYNSEPAVTDAPVIFDIALLFDNLSFCCDLICGTWNKRVLFSSTPVSALVSGNPKQLGWAFLNLVTNAVIHSDGRYIGITLAETENHFVIKTENEGHFAIRRFHDALETDGGGLDFVSRAVAAHGGSLILTADDRKVTMTFTVLKADENSEPEYCVPPVEDLLYDRLSPIHTALCEL